MSASEKLKALDEATPAPWHQSAKRVVEMNHRSTIAVVSEHYGSENDARLIAALRNALPQIVAALEIAETNLPIYDAALIASGMNTTPNKKLYAALAALDEALS